MKIEMGPKALIWMGTGIQAAMVAMKGVNFTLKQMLGKTAGRLDVAESKLTVEYGRFEGDWGWQARLNKGGVVHTSSTQLDPMRALGALVTEIEK